MGASKQQIHGENVLRIGKVDEQIDLLILINFLALKKWLEEREMQGHQKGAEDCGFSCEL